MSAKTGKESPDETVLRSAIIEESIIVHD